MNKVVKVILFLFLITVVIQILFTIFGDGHDILYNIKDDEKIFSIKETYKHKLKYEKNHYTIVINDMFTYKIFHNLNKRSNIIKEIRYFENDNFKCIYPIFKDKKLKLDVQCNNGNYLVFYQSIKGKNAKIDKFVNDIKEYDEKQFIDNKESKEENTFLSVYRNNIIDNLYFATSSYKGLYLINNNEKHKKINQIELYNSDVYEPDIVGSVGKLIIAANYNSEDNYDALNLINITDGSKTQFKTNHKLSFNAFIMGIEEEDIYLLDKENKEQYKINPKKQTVDLVGNVNIGAVVYNNHKKETIEFNRVIEENKMFNGKTNYNNDNFDKVIETDDFYYLLKKENGTTKVYRKNKDNLNLIIYLFETSNMKNIVFDSGYVFFIDRSEVKYYSDETGLKTAFKHSEMEFNNSIKYFVYLK